MRRDLRAHYKDTYTVVAAASGDEALDGLKTIVTWTLTPCDGGTLVRMEQSGFRPQDEAGYRGMGGGWPRILVRLEQVSSKS